jgi:hypothetical protein
MLTGAHSLASALSTSKSDAASYWLQIWHLASRSLSNPNSSRSASHLLDILLKSSILHNSDISKLVDSTLFADGLNGPVGMSDAALSLWLSIAESRIANGQAAKQQTVSRFIKWLAANYHLSLLAILLMLSGHLLTETLLTRPYLIEANGSLCHSWTSYAIAPLLFGFRDSDTPCL